VLITFRSKAAANIAMFGDVAMTLLKMAGHSSTIPGAFAKDDIPHALASLHSALRAANGKSGGSHASAGGTSEQVSLQQRAYPLIQMMTAASARGCSVAWDREHRAA